MTTLEQRYARILRLLPKTYQDDRAEVMLTALMDAADPGQTRPSLRETLSILVLAVRLRIAPRPASAGSGLVGQVLRRAVLVGLVAECIDAVHWDFFSSSGWGRGGGEPWFAPLEPLLLPAVILVLLLLGGRRLGRALCGLVLLVLVYQELTAASFYGPWYLFDLITTFASTGYTYNILLMLCAIVAFRSGTPALTGRRWWFAAWIGGSIAVGVAARQPGGSAAMTAVFAVGFWAMAVWSVSRARVSPVWPLALLVVVEQTLRLAFVMPGEDVGEVLRFQGITGPALAAEAVLAISALASLLFAYTDRRSRQRHVLPDAVA
ncbi:hypothetical protein KGQ19_22575 [Catenulispora sp. NL8]|uniref:Uncharacterized protein n=1 Tax=Catenulispora pinistramenti TaxID=2705254 RepID=A0ABS5KUB4_9ACTN|nr:hypothetical protein [Catenulispora pinistramenti]MBS2549653.1 hypothetical protein [Catenulispora pinistramenti]